MEQKTTTKNERKKEKIPIKKKVNEMKRNNLQEKEKQKNNVENGEVEETLVILGRLK